jgi:hypothetical protein
MQSSTPQVPPPPKKKKKTEKGHNMEKKKKSISMADCEPETDEEHRIGADSTHRRFSFFATWRLLLGPLCIVVSLHASI